MMRERTHLANAIECLSRHGARAGRRADPGRAGRGRGRSASRSTRPQARAHGPAGRGRASASWNRLLSGEADQNDCYLEVHAGAGGTEAQDWAEMLLRMYTRWAEQHGYKVEWLEESAGRRSRHQVRDHRDQGPERLWLAEDRNPACTAWCASRPSIPTRGATPASPRSGSIRWSTTTSRSRSWTRISRSTPSAPRGAGGQHINKTDSAIRITHMPTGIVVRLPGRPLAASQPRHGDGHAEGAALRGGAAEARGSRRGRRKRRRATSAGATRSAPTCCSPTRW